MMQVREDVDKPCRISDSQKIRKSDKPFVCSDIDGKDISNQSKRDVGMMLDVIITYKNKCFPASHLSQTCTADVFYRDTGFFSIIPTYDNIDSRDIEYTIDVRSESD